MAISYTDNVAEQVGTSSAITYQAPTVLSAHVVYAVCFNEGAADATLTINVVKNGDSADVTNRYVNRVVPAGNRIILDELVGRVLNSSDAIYSASSVASTLNLSIGVKEITQ